VIKTDPVVVLAYGPSGIGKTVDDGYSFPRALFLAAPGALTSIERTCGYKPDSAPVLDIETAIAVMDRVAKKYKTIVVDDFSFMAEQTFAKLESKYKGFTIWSELRNIVLAFRDKSRTAGVNVVLNCWEQPPKRTMKGESVRGGPKLSGNLPESMPAMCDLVLRGVHDTKRQPWPVVYKCAADPSWIQKDRFDVASQLQNAPMNLGEILRAAGLDIERHAQYPKQEDQVKAISDTFSGDPATDGLLANQVFKGLRDKDVSFHEARWTLRDALDRAVIREGLRAAQTTFIASPGF